jgi:hypothetical protein
MTKYLKLARTEIRRRQHLSPAEIERQVSKLVGDRLFDDGLNDLVERGELGCTAKGVYYIKGEGR